MKLYLLRHGVAFKSGTARFTDATRPLTPEGIERMTKAAKGLRKVLKNVDAILTSPFARALETARIVARELDCENLVKSTNLLLPGAACEKVVKNLSKYAHLKSLLLVGHEPMLSTLAAFLVNVDCVNEGRAILELRKGGICLIEFPERVNFRGGKVELVITPKVLRALA